MLNKFFLGVACWVWGVGVVGNLAEISLNPYLPISPNPFTVTRVPDLNKQFKCAGSLPIFRWSITQFSGKKSRNFPPDHSNSRHFLISKKSKSLIQQGF
ncbi:MAG: hypothetical protein EWV55_02015 [Microcystis viridis Mv_BB_P_19951000_S69]|uniref:Uncharacterized protein n=1 Tax=Microcystis viridis Mv_BB_P_19951000_S68D TaxID=2486270 RepID=A0A552HD29_MICVR|nr:MAG: hypothetical protein EWV77_19250 [Microcystis viridis Mv_BB_P_19951000_S68D]TRU78035.1 MAG: hypothetical protein EWV47_02735 [Microcystis viridis Mv_BB_P_19951000_S68]TRU78801.1 MAG: hypothetical protein EWV55_02015 [Microcystis viridis Mv_BB_P_19951000_S69]TRU90019.1 MAG: hypothetical protein EWV46_02515 [Microcystis viridis Mv_BB_P_19951000_S69D]